MLENVGDVGTIFWGNAFTCPVSPKKPEFQGWMQQFVTDHQLQQLVYLKQEHLATGLVLDQSLEKSAPSTIFSAYEGDYLITNQVKLGIAILTADCLPIVLYDPVQKIIAVAHAGWKGTVRGIAANVVKQMHERFGSQPEQLKVSFGAHAHTCCYEVQADFMGHIRKELLAHVVVQREGKNYFDSAAYNKLELVAAGVVATAITNQFNCTICDDSYHSRRRDGAEYVGQSTIVWLSTF